MPVCAGNVKRKWHSAIWRKVSKYEAGLRTPNMDMIMKLSDVLGCTTDYLLGRTIFPYSELTTLEDKFLGAFFAADRSEQQAVWKILEKYMDL